LLILRTFRKARVSFETVEKTGIIFFERFVKNVGRVVDDPKIYFYSVEFAKRVSRKTADDAVFKTRAMYKFFKERRFRIVSGRVLPNIEHRAIMSRLNI